MRPIGRTLVVMAAVALATPIVLAQGGTSPIGVARPVPAAETPAPAAVEPGAPLEIGIWSLRAGGPDRPVLFVRCLRGGEETVASGPGRAFALVPLAASNTSMEMDSLIGPTWILHDGEGATYTPVVIEGLRLDEGVPIDLVHVPLGAERSGFLVFEVPEDVRVLSLEFGGFRPGARWRLDVSDERGDTCPASLG